MAVVVKSAFSICCKTVDERVELLSSFQLYLAGALLTSALLVDFLLCLFASCNRVAAVIELYWLNLGEVTLSVFEAM